MKNTKLTIAISSVSILTIAVITSYLLYKNNILQKSQSNDTVVANYENGVVTASEAQTELSKLIVKNPNLEGLTFNDLNAAQKEMVIKEIVLKEISYKEAKRRKLDKSDDYKQTLKFFESEVLKQKLFLKLVTDAKEEKNVRKNYDKLAKDLESKKDIRLSYIAVKTKDEADTIFRILDQHPNEFARQAERKSIDKKIAAKGGDLGFVLEDAIPTGIVEQYKKLKKGQISNPFKLSDKWIIIKLEDQRKAEVTKFEDVKEELAKNLSMKALQDFISNSLKEANISIVVQ